MLASVGETALNRDGERTIRRVKTAGDDLKSRRKHDLGKCEFQRITREEKVCMNDLVFMSFNSASASLRHRKLASRIQDLRHVVTRGAQNLLFNSTLCWKIHNLESFNRFYAIRRLKCCATF